VALLYTLASVALALALLLLGPVGLLTLAALELCLAAGLERGQALSFGAASASAARQATITVK
jgi:hypothetical protein